MAKRGADGQGDPGGSTAKRPMIEYINLLEDSDDDEPKPTIQVGGRWQSVSPEERAVVCVCVCVLDAAGGYPLHFSVRDPLPEADVRRKWVGDVQTNFAAQLAETRRAQHQRWQATPRSPPRADAPQQALPSNLHHVFVAAAPYPHAGPTTQCLGLPCVRRGDLAAQVFAATDARNAEGLSLSARVQGRLLGRAFVGTSGACA